ncbi:MAG: protein phosphatase 2C domain-containing protein [Gammaproteobacteria bacterium]|nr:protein phosphatase 2C domain-containing protein [Gammaproteobacteria bacterium]
MHSEIICVSRQGDRATNQDRCLAVERAGSALLLLADGMGGHPRGELAAQVYIDSMTRQFNGAERPLAEPGEFLRRSIEQAHHDIVAAGLQQTPPVDPRTTAVACIVQDRQARWAHVGDSRLYLIRDGRVLERTRDHSLVEELIQRGELEESGRALHPLRNYVSRALGGDKQLPGITLSAPCTLQARDLLLLCSDGLWASVPETLLACLAGAGLLEQAASELGVAAERAAHPGSDNVTLLACRVTE